MNQLDIFLGGAVLLFALSGLFGGAVKRVLQVAALVIAFRESWHLTPYLQQLLGGAEGEQLGGWMVLLPLLSFALVYILGYGCLLVEGILPTRPYDSQSQLPPSARQASYLYPRLIAAVDEITEAKTLLFGEPSEDATSPQPQL